MSAEELSVAISRFREAGRALLAVTEKSDKLRPRPISETEWAEEFHTQRVAITERFFELLHAALRDNIQYREHWEGVGMVFPSILQDVTGMSQARRAMVHTVEMMGTLQLAVARTNEVPSRPLTEPVLPSELVANTRGYLEKLTEQANGCYERGWYDACAVLIRRLVENLIILVYEQNATLDEITGTDGNFLGMNELIDDLSSRREWHLDQETRKTLPLVRNLGNRSAHKRHYLARRPDIDAVLPGFRVLVEDLLHLAKLR